MTPSSESWPQKRRVTVVTDTPGWFDPFADHLVDAINGANHSAERCLSYDAVGQGDIAFFLSCMRLAKPEILARNRFNIVVHASDLPKDRGFSPIVWSILEGASRIIVSAIFMGEDADSGPVLMKRQLDFQGHELNAEIRTALGDLVVDICLEILMADTPPAGMPQTGTPTWRRRRTPQDSQLDPNKTIADQFDLLRVVDNDAYPAFFDHLGHRYEIKITKSNKLP